MAEPYDYQDAVFKHEPCEPPRANHIGEMIYAAAWKRHISAPFSEWWSDGFPNERFITMLSCYPWKIGNREARVAASLIVWLGTNCGQSFVHQAKKRGEGRSDQSNEFLMEWAVTNRRFNWLNSGARTIEAIVGTPEKDKYFGYLVKIPHVSYHDTEIIEMVVCYLGTERGRKFIDDTEAEIDCALKIADEMERMRHRARALAEGLST